MRSVLSNVSPWMMRKDSFCAIRDQRETNNTPSHTFVSNLCSLLEEIGKPPASKHIQQQAKVLGRGPLGKGFQADAEKRVRRIGFRFLYSGHPRVMAMMSRCQ